MTRTQTATGFNTMAVVGLVKLVLLLTVGHAFGGVVDYYIW